MTLPPTVICGWCHAGRHIPGMYGIVVHTKCEKERIAWDRFYTAWRAAGEPNMTMAQIAKVLDITPERVRQIFESARRRHEWKERLA